MTARLLRREGYDVVATTTKSEAVRLCKEHSFDLLIADIGLPDGSGCDLMIELAAMCNIKGIAFTAYGYQEDVARGRIAGFSAYLLKPLALKEILSAIDKVLEVLPE